MSSMVSRLRDDMQSTSSQSAGKAQGKHGIIASVLCTGCGGDGTRRNHHGMHRFGLSSILERLSKAMAPKLVAFMQSN